MGTRVAPSYANIFMSDFEQKHIYSYRLQPKVWYRYIDDIFCIWQYGIEELNGFLTHINSVHRTIKFTAEISKTEINFLDTTVKLNEGEITTDLYCKPTDRNNYLPFNSAHPFHCKKGLPYGQFLRIRRICSMEEDFERHVAYKAALLLQKKYPIDLLAEAYRRSKERDHQELLQDSMGKHEDGKQEGPIFLTTTFHPEYKGLQTQVRKT